MASALRSEAKDDLDILGEDGCLEKLRAIYLRKCPKWFRRYEYFKCTQDEGETVEDFWNRKLDWERYCDLDGMKTEDLRVFELICGI